MPKVKDLSGVKFGRLTAVRRTNNSGKVTVWTCKCECGNYKDIRYPDLVVGRTTSCGCKQRENLLARNHKHGMATTKGRSRLYLIWAGMKTRCTNENAPQYEWYGGRGIKICEEWLNSFENFRDWALSNCYNDNLSIDRINVNGHYEPSNCRWSSNKEQGRNRRTNHLVNINGTEKTLIEWCETQKINYATVQDRIKRGWDEVKAILEPSETKFGKGSD